MKKTKSHFNKTRCQVLKVHAKSLYLRERSILCDKADYVTLCLQPPVKYIVVDKNKAQVGERRLWRPL